MFKKEAYLQIFTIPKIFTHSYSVHPKDFEEIIGTHIERRIVSSSRRLSLAFVRSLDTDSKSVKSQSEKE